jgi:hypothetical protein
VKVKVLVVFSLRTLLQPWSNHWFKLDKTREDIYEMLQTIYGDKTLNGSSVYEWFTYFFL